MLAMLPGGRRLGVHLPLARGMVKAAERAAEIGADVVQVFSDNPTTWARRAAASPELPAFRAAIAAGGLEPIAIHASYLINLAGANAEFRDRSVALLVHELLTAPSFGASILNVHIGSHLGDGAAVGIGRVAEAVARAHAAVPGGRDATILVLENAAGSGGGLGTDGAELAAILEASLAAGADPARLGFCLDTAHAWGAGHDVGTAAGVDTLLADLDATIGLEWIRLVHLNDSRSERGSRTDRHEHLGEGLIGVDGLARILTHPRLGDVSYILETPGMDEGYDLANLTRARALAADPTAPLPFREPIAAAG